MPDDSRTDQEKLERLAGLFVGQLTDEELALFNRAVSLGCAQRSYEGGAGFMGLAKVRLVLVPKEMP